MQHKLCYIQNNSNKNIFVYFGPPNFAQLVPRNSGPKLSCHPKKFINRSLFSYLSCIDMASKCSNYDTSLID